MKLQTALEGLAFFAYHGLYPFEKEKGATFIVDVWVNEEIEDVNPLNTIDQVINYEAIFNIVKEEMEIRRDLIEDLAKTILARISMLLVERKVQVKVKITKPNPGGLFGSGAASVTLEC
jgi:7,8-dihydroneopterin aldolase/epimerase/oxygenase